MSGGVDSAVAAARAVDAGFDVTGVHLALARNPKTYRTGARGCCSREDARDARRAADVLDIPFYVWDLADRFHEDVVDDFVAEYAAGRTPNPCLRCNEKIKFAAVLDRALALGFDAVVTGHHARLGADGLLRRSVDLAKDQSYVLAVLTRDQLDHSVFPLGDSTKEQVRAEAARRGLAVADKPDSHDICFIADGDTQRFLASRLGHAPGDIVEAGTGRVVGRHDGAYAYTVGQRRGLRLEQPAPDGRPRYVLSITPVTNTVTVGPAEALEVWTVHGGRPVWTVGAATGIGSLPGTDFAEAVKIVFGEVPDFPHLPELPARGPGADMIGRGAGLLVDLPVEIYAGRWRVTARPGRDARVTRDLLERDLDAVTEHAAEYTGPLKVASAGPWTLASSVQLQLDEPSLPAVLAGPAPTESGFSTLPAPEPATVQGALAGIVETVSVPVVVHCCAAGVPVGLVRETGAVAIA